MPDKTPEELLADWRHYAEQLETRIRDLEKPAPSARWFESPRVVGILSEISSCLTLLAALPYELGDAANLMSPEWKVRIAGIGVFATLALRLWKRYLEPKPTEKK